MAKPTHAETIGINFEKAQDALAEARAALKAAEAHYEQASKELLDYFDRVRAHMKKNMHGEPIG